MAITHKQAIMVLHQEGTAASTLAPQTSLFVVIKQLHPVCGGQDLKALQKNKETNPVGKSAIGSNKTSFNKTSISLSTMANTDTSNQSCNLPAEAIRRSVTVTLDNNSMWNEFFRCQTEMILTKQGRRMFPYCRFRISGLEPFQRYSFVMDMHPVDNHRYKWSDRRWETNGKGDPHIPCLFVHPDSPASGFDWMQNPVSFFKLKLTNNPLDREDHIVINSMHRYLPRLHIFPADKATHDILLSDPDVITFSFPQTEFFAVTGYQNLSITQLKIDYNPFAKGFREDACNSRSGKPKIGSSNEKLESEAKFSRETRTLNNLKSLFAKRNAAGKLPINKDIKPVHCDSPMTTEPEKSLSDKKRPWPGGLSDLIKNSNVKVKKMSLEKIIDDNDQQMNICMDAEDKNSDVAAEDCKSNISISAVAEETNETKLKNIERADFKNISEGPVVADIVSFLQPKNSSATETFSTTKIQCKPANEATINTPINEKVETTVSEATTLPDSKCKSKETSQTVVKPLNPGEPVKKKRAESVTLPLLALFLQQLKSKTRPARTKATSESCSSELHSDASYNTTSVDVKSTSTETCTSFKTQTNELESPPISQNISLSITTKPKTVLSPDSAVNSIAASTSALVTSQESTSEKELVTTPAVVLTTTPNTCLSSKESQSSIAISTIVPNSFSNLAFSCASDSLTATASEAPHNELPQRNITPSDLSEPAINLCTVSFSKPAPEAVQHSPVLDNMPSSPPSSPAPSSRDVSPPRSASSSPDPFPPSLFSERPIPPRKSLDPFPPYLSLDRTRPLMLVTDPLLQSFNYRLTRSGDSGPAVGACKTAPSIVATDPCIPNATKQSVQMSASIDLKGKYKADEKSKLCEGAEIMEHPIPVPAVELSEDSAQAVDNDSSGAFSPVISSQPCISRVIGESLSAKPGTKVLMNDKKEITKQSLMTQESKTSKVKHKKARTEKLTENAEKTEALLPVPMQPSLEDVEGQLFVSFTSKKALKIHLEDKAKEDDVLEKAETKDGKTCNDRNERIDALEKSLLRDLKVIKHRQVIHPVLQEVGLKLNLLDLTLAIDLKYLGVCLPIPLPNVLPGESPGGSSSQVPFVSRTGKTSDFTKIKGWRDKFATTTSAPLPPVSICSDGGQKNLSAFCSDMLDEYLASEGKLIDERASSFSQAIATPVAYQMPTKSTSYVRTLDSVLKKQTPLTTAASFKPFVAMKKAKLKSKSKEAVVSREKLKKFLKSGAEKAAANTNKQSSTNVEGSSLKKSIKSVPSKSITSETSAALSLSQRKKSIKDRTKKGSKTLQALVHPTVDPDKGSTSMTSVVKDSNSGNPSSSSAGGRNLGLSKTLVKLLDVEDGAVWEGKRRTWITEERAAIALSCLITAEGTVGGSSSTIIKRRAPPCLNDFCRLGCICTSLVQERRQHHCGKLQCMLGCNCLRRKVVVLKSPEGCKKKENETKAKKKKRRMSFVLFGSEVAPEPATRVTTLWNRNKVSNDLEQLSIPTPARHSPVQSPPPQQNAEDQASKNIDEDLSIVKDQESCARMRPFCWKNESPARKGDMTEDGPDLSLHDPLQETEEGELLPPTQSGPTKRLEIVSKCKWPTEGSRNAVLRSVCEHMAQDHLDHPFWVGSFRIDPVSKTVSENADDEPVITYKVVISMPNLEKSKEQMRDEKIKLLEAQLIETIGKSEVKGLPLLSHVTPAGLLKAEKKLPGAPGQIMVNEKPYPQAKLELGHMGALHPANRLAAYITGRVCLTYKLGSQAATTATITQTSSTAPTTTTTTTTTTTCNSTTSVKPNVVKPLVGPDFAQVVINHVSSVQQKLPDSQVPLLQSTSKKIVIPSLNTGPTSIFNTPPKTSMASQSTAPPVTKVVKINPNATKSTFMMNTTRPRSVLSGDGVRLTPPVPGQRMVLFKTPSGNFMYRNSTGQVVWLMPLGQFRVLNPNVSVPQQSAMIRLPTPNTVTLSKPQTKGSTFTMVTPVTQSSSTIRHQNVTQVHNTTCAATTTSASIMATKPVICRAASNCLLLNGQSSTVKIVPRFLSSTGTSTERIVPQIIEYSKIVKDAGITTTSTSIDQSSSEAFLANQGFIPITSQTCLTSQSQDHESASAVQISSTSAKVQEEHHVKAFQCPTSSDEVIFADHSYTFEMKKSTTSYETPADVPKGSALSAQNSEPHTVTKEVMDLSLTEVVEESCIKDVFLETQRSRGSQAGTCVEEVEINSDFTELTDDSDMYADTDSAHSSIFTDSYTEEKKDEKQSSLDVRLQELTEYEDELVDVETLEEKLEKSTAPIAICHDESQTSDENENADILKCQKNSLERRRRSALKNCFDRLQQTLHPKDYKPSKLSILKLALKEIQSLTAQRDHLIKRQNKLKKKKAYYLKVASQLSGKTKESISEKLDEVISKQKSLTKGNQASDICNTPTLKGRTKRRNKKDKDPVRSCAMAVSISQQKSLVRGNKQKSAFGSSQLTKNLPPKARERTRPNILSRNKSQNIGSEKVSFPQVIPLAGTVVPCSQIITIQNPLHPTDNQSSTPGVAAVSISVPVSVEGPLPSLQLQEPNLTASLLNIDTSGQTVNLPKISSVVSLVLPENMFTAPPVVLQQTVKSVSQTAGNCAPEESQQKSCTEGVPFGKNDIQVDKQLPEIEATQPGQDATATAPSNQKEAKEKTPNGDQEDENLMSLLDELVFLNQQLNEETLEPQEKASSLTDAREVLTNLLTEKGVNRDDERSLSPLFLKLDEDLITSSSSKEEIDDIPPKVDDLVKAIFGSDSASSEPEAVATASEGDARVPACRINPSLPPLLHMKAGGASAADSIKEQTNLFWRPMPKLAPLGLKIQDSGQSKVNSPVLRPDSK